MIRDHFNVFFFSGLQYERNREIDQNYVTTFSGKILIWETWD